MLDWVEPAGCDGSEKYIIDNTNCNVTYETLMEEPYSLKAGEKFGVRVLVVTETGERVFLAENLSVEMPWKPEAPRNIWKDKQESFMSPDNGDLMTLAIKWEQPTEGFGTPILDYRIEMKTEVDPWTEIAIGYEDNTFLKSDLFAGREYEFKVQARNIMGYGPMSDVLTVIAGVPPAAPDKPNVEVTDKGLHIDWE